MLKTALLTALALFTAGYALIWILAVMREGRERPADQPAPKALPGPLELFIGFVTNFFDTLGIGSFATTSSAFKLARLVHDEDIPGTMNVGHTAPTIVEALIYIAVVQVEPVTLVSMLGASALGAWLGAGVVSGWPRRKIQIGMGSVLIAAAILMALSQLQLMPGGGNALGVSGAKLIAAIAGNFLLGALMTLGIGLYAPCMVLVALLGMNLRAAFPIMMGSCAFLMPVASIPFIRARAFDRQAALGLTIGGVPAIFLAAYGVKSLPLDTVRWLVVVVVLYTAATMWRSSMREGQKSGFRVPGSGFREQTPDPSSGAQ